MKGLTEVIIISRMIGFTALLMLLSIVTLGQVVFASGADGDLNAVLAEAKSKLVIPNRDDVRGNITLPSEIGVNGKKVNITWESSNPNIVTDKPTEENKEIPAGVVHRQSTDQQIAMTATLEFNGDVIEKVINVTVRKATQLDEFTDYIYMYFRSDLYGNGESQQIHLAASKDGFFWDDLNNNEPILESTLGTKGVRDHYIIRAPEGDKFYLIATDLDANAGNWGEYANNGSKSIIVWESNDLVNWSEQRMVEIAPEDAGNAWAPETIYDPATGEYVVYWSSNVNGEGHRIYYAKTRDFWTFTEPKIYKDRTDTNTFIDTSMIEHNGSYYRFTKNEQNLTVLLEKSDSVLGDFELVKERVGGQEGVEGPAIFKLNGQEKWVLLLDGYAGSNAGVGFFPLIAENAEDLASGNFRRLEDTEYRMPTGAKHGSVLPVTQKEYAAIMAKWGQDLVEPVTPDTGEELTADLEYTFEETLQGNIVKNTGASGFANNGMLHNEAIYVDDEEKGKVLYLGGGNADTNSPYLEFPQGYFDGRDNVSIFMDVKSEMDNQFFFTFGVGQDYQKYLFLRPRPSELYAALTVKSHPKEQKIVRSLSNSLKNDWTNIGLVLERNQDGKHSTMKLYKDGELVGVNTELIANLSTIGANLKAYLGKSFYSNPYFKGYFDNVRIYNRALTDEQVHEVLHSDGPLDETSPEINAMINGNTLQNEVTVYDTDSVQFTWEVKDDESGVANVSASFDGEVYEEGTAVDLAGKPGKHELLVTAVDKAGNVQEKSYIIHVTTSADGMETLVQRFKEAGEFDNYSTARSLQVHLIAVSHFEEKGTAKKVAKHMESFQQLLAFHEEQGLISEKAYQVLKADASYLIDKWSKKGKD